MSPLDVVWEAFIMEICPIDYGPNAKNTPAPPFTSSTICPAEFGISIWCWRAYEV